MKDHNTDVLIIGAGPAGSIAAMAAQQQGLSVTVVEKLKFPRFIIGESLLPKCMEHFEEVGVMDLLKKQNYQKKPGVRFLRDDLECTFDFSEQYSESWSWTWQVPRAHFDKVLADEVERRGIDLHYETEVTDITLHPDATSTTTVKRAGETKEINARFIIDCSGYGRVIPRLFNLNRPNSEEPRKAVFGHFTDRNRPSGVNGQKITFIIHKRDVWIWIIPFSTGMTSVGFVGNTAYLESFAADDANVHLRRLIHDVPYARERFATEDTVIPAKSVSAYTVATTETFGPGYVITGNSSEFIDPVFSSGVTFATESGLLAAKLVARQLKGEAVDWKTEYQDHMSQGVETFRTYVKHWYDGSLQDIFFYSNADANQKIKRQICSVLAGHVWDKTNPFVGPKRARALTSVSKIIKLY